MKRLFCFFAMVMLCVDSLTAKADELGFRFEILDPTGPFLGYVDGTAPFGVQFGTICPRGISASGCFTAFNNTAGTTFTSLSLSFTNTTSSTSPTDFFNYLNGQPALCDVTPSNSVFGMTSCGLSADKSTYRLTFSGGAGFTPGEYIVLAETGASPDAFQNVAGTVLPMVTAATPEPGSLWLMATGFCGLGALLYRQRRMALEH